MHQASAVRRSLARVSTEDFAGEPLEGGLCELATLMAQTVGDISHRLNMLNEILVGLREPVTA